MASIDEIISKEALDRVIQLTDAINKAAKGVDDLYSSSKKLDSALKSGSSGGGGGKSYDEQKKLNAEQQEAIRIAKELEKTQAKLAIVGTEYSKQLEVEKQKLIEANKAQQESIKQNNTEVGSINYLIAENKKLKKERDSISTSTEIGRKKIAELNAMMEENTKIINANGTSQEKQRANIGNYKSGITDLWDSFKNGEVSLGGLTKGFLSLSKSLLMSPLGWVLLIFILIKEAIGRNAEIMEKLEVALSPINKLFGAILGVVGDLVSFLVGGFVTAMETVISLFGSQEQAIRNTMKATKDLQDAEKERLQQSIKEADTQNQLNKLQQIYNDKSKTKKERLDALNKANDLQIDKAKEVYDTEKKSLEAAMVLLKDKYDIKEKLLNKDGTLSEIALSKLSKEDRDKLAQDIITFKNAQNEKNDILADSTKKISGIKLQIKKDDEDTLKEQQEKQKEQNEKLKKIAEDKYLFESQLRKATIDNMKEGVDKQIALENFNYEAKIYSIKKDFQNKSLANKLIEQANIEHNKNLTAIEETTIDQMLIDSEKEAKMLSEIDQYELDTKIKALQDGLTAYQTSAQLEKDLAIKVARDKFLASDKGVKAKEDYEKEIQRIEFESQKKILQSNIDFLQKQIALLPDGNAVKIKYAEELAAKQKELNDAVFENQYNNDQKSTSSFEEKTKSMQDFLKENEKYISAAIDIENELFNLANVGFENKLTELDESKKRELDNKNLTEEQKKAIETKYDKESSKVKTQQAKAEKAQALFSIAINTAKGVVAALPNIPLSILIGVLGAVQAGVVLSKKIPAFEKGTQFAPGGAAIVGEKGTELIESNGKFSLSPSNATMIDLPRGSKVIPHQKTMEMIQSKSDKDLNDTLLMRIEKAVLKGNQSTNSTAYDTYIQAGKTRDRRLDIYFR